MTVERDPHTPDDFEIHLNPAKIAWKTGPTGKLTADIALYAQSFDRKGKALHRHHPHHGPRHRPEEEAQPVTVAAAILRQP